MDALVGATVWFSGREIEASVDEAMRRAYLRVKRDGAGDVTTDDVLGVVGETVALARQRVAEVARMRAWGATARAATAEKFDGVDDNGEYVTQASAAGNAERFVDWKE